MYNYYCKGYLNESITYLLIGQVDYEDICVVIQLHEFK